MKQKRNTPVPRMTDPTLPIAKQIYLALTYAQDGAWFTAGLILAQASVQCLEMAAGRMMEGK